MAITFHIKADEVESLVPANVKVKIDEKGQATVTYCAEQLNLSANYFGDLVKKETGRSAQEYIQTKLMEVAKARIFDRSKTINEVAFELGYKYPRHFSRFFKERAGQSPNEYRTLHDN